MTSHRSTRLSLIISLLLGFSTLILKAQDAPTSEPPTATVVPSDIPPTDIPPTPVPPPTDVPTETFTPEPSLTPLPAPTDTPVPTASDTASPEASLTPSETSTDAASPTLTASPSLTATASATVSLTPSMTASAEMQNQMGVIQPLANIACTPSASIQQANVSSAGERGDVSGNMNSLSSDGRYLYFPSKAANLVVNDGNNAVDYFEFDRTNCNTRRITVGPNGEEGNGDSDVGNISGNGQFFAFASKASTFVAGDTNGKYDIFVKNLSTNAVTRIPADPTDAISGAYYIGDVTISDDGRYVAFDVLVPAQTYTGFTGTPVLYDTQTSTRTMIAAEGRSLYISGDGNYVAFASSVANLVGGDTNNIDDIFLYQRATGAFSRVSIATDGTQTLSQQNYYNISISNDGRYVAFDTSAALVADDTNGALTTDVYVRDRLTNQTNRVSVNTNGSQIAGGGGLARMSADGHYVLFMSSGNSIWIRDRQSSQTYQITNPYTSNGGLDISADGNYVAFSTQAGSTRDVYVAKRSGFAPSTPTPTPIPTTTPGIILGNFACSPSAAMSIASVDSAGTQGTSGSYGTNMSAIGRYIAFDSGSVNLVYGDTNGQGDVFVFDRLTCQTVRASVAADGTQGKAGSAYPSVSSDGRYVTFLSLASNLVAGDSNNLWDVFIKDLQTGAVTRLQTGFAGTGGDYGAAFVAGDDHTVIFRTSNTISQYDILTQQQTVLVTAANLRLIRNAISSDLRYLVFSSTTNNLVLNDTNNLSDVFLFDRQTSQTIRLSVSPTGTGGDSNSDYASISADGRYAVFNSYASNLAGTNAVFSIEVFVRDLQNLVTYQVSVSSDGAEGNGSSAYGSISDDGRYVAFLSESTNLISGDNNSQDDVFVRDRQTNQTYLISRIPAGALGNGQSDRPMMSRDGKYIAFASGASNLLTGDANYAWDVFVAQADAFAPSSVSATQTAIASATAGAGTATARAFATQTAAAATATVFPATQTAQAVNQTATAYAANCPIANSAPLQIASVSSGGVQGNNDSGANTLAISDTGRYTLYISSATSLVANDTNSKDDIFIFDRTTCSTTRVSTALDGTQANDASSSAAMSADGQIIAFASAATNLVVGDTNSGIFVRNFTANTLIRIPNTDSTSSLPSISGDGRYVTYQQSNGNGLNIVLYDLQTGQSTPVASSVNTRARSKISRDSSVVVYISGSLANGSLSLSIYNRTTLQTSTQAFTVDSSNPSIDISADGRYVVFTSFDSNLVANDTNNTADAFLLDRQNNQITRVNVSTTNGNANANAAFPAISPDGHFVSFTSTASNLVSGDTNNATDIFVRDLSQQITYIVSKNPNETQSNNGAGAVSAPFSGDDLYVVFASYANTLIAGDSGFVEDVFIASNLAYHPNYSATATAAAATATTAALTPSPTIDPFTTVTPGGPIPCLPSSSTSVVSVSSGGAIANNPGVLPVPSAGNYSISDTGRYIVYLSASTNLVSNDTNGKTDLFVFDRENCLTTKLSNALDGTQANNDSTWSAISADGQTVVFGSLATNLIPNDTNGGIFVRDFQNNTLTRISGVENVYYTPSISGDGRYITFPENVNANTSNIILFDRQTSQKQTIDTVSATGVVSKISRDGSTVIYSYNYSVMAAYNRSTQQKTLKTVTGLGNPIYGVSGNGRYVVFSSNANNLTANDVNGTFDVFLWDRQNDFTSLISVSSNGIQGNGASAYPDISPDGRYVTFFSSATNLVANDTNNSTDVFVRDLVQQVIYVVSASPGGTVGNQGSGIYGSPISGDNRFVVFFSSATNLVAGVTGQLAQVYVAQRAVFAPPDISATQTAVAPATATANAIATATYTAANGLIVNTTSNTDDGTCNISHCSLVEAVNASNAMVGVQIIKFNIPGIGVHTITLNSSLILTSSAIIDGTTQPGYSGAPLIELVPLSSTTPYTAIVINGATPTTYDPNTSVTIRGLIINSFSGFGIHVSNGQQHLLEANYIGTDATGTIAEGNDTGIIITSPNNTIRDNVISGNLNAGIYMNSNGGRNSTNNLIVGNYIGTDASGLNELPNQRGIRITEGASNNTIGGTADGTANLISGNTIEGILIDGNTTNGNIITGNIIGLDANSQYLLGNGTSGIGISAALHTVIGGATAAEGNDIWGNAYGINLYNAANNTIIRNNVIAQNSTQGVVISTNNNTISENTIAFHSGQGIVVSSGTGNRISQNRIYSNGTLGIDLGLNGISANDISDADTGANNLQNFPVITSAVDSGLTSSVNGSLNSLPNQTYHLEFFSNEVCSTSGYGQGQTYIGAKDVTTDANGNVNFAAQVGSLALGNNFGTNWSGTFYPSNDLTGTDAAVNNIQGLSFLWGTGAPMVNGVAVSGMPSDNFSARFTSTQTFAAGTYTFIVSADDGVRVYIDGVLTLDKFVGRVLTTDSFTTSLTAGSHALTVEYFEGIDQAALQVQWHLNGSLNGFVTGTATDANGNTSEFAACKPIQFVLGVGGYQETNPNLVPSGSWITYTGSGPEGGSYKFTNDPNAKFNFYVDETVGRIVFYRTTYPIYGPAEVYMDGALIATMNNTSSALQFGVPFTISITPGNHLIELRNKGASYMSLDQVDLLPPAQALTTNPGTYQDRNVNLSYSGKWILNTHPSLLAQSSRYTNDPNARVSFNVDSSVGRVIICRTTYLSSVYGSLQVFVDGAATPLTTLNNTSSSIQFGVPFGFYITPGNHTIELRNAGSTYSDIDQITLLPPAVPLTTTPGSYQEDASELLYSGVWSSSSTTGPLGGARKYTNDPNASVSFSVDSSVGRIKLYRTTYAAGVYGSLQVFVDNSLTPLTTIPNTSAAFLYGQPFTFSVTPGNHIITLKNVGSTYSDIDQITLLPPPAALAVGTYEETEANLVYSGTWLSSVTTGPLGGSRIYTSDPAASMTFNIDSSVGRVTLYRTTYAAGVYGSLQVYLDGSATPFMTIPNTSLAFLYGQPFTFAVTPGSHTLTLKNVGSTYSDIDRITLQAAAPLPAGIYQENDANLIYNGTWTANSNASSLGGARKYTNDPNATLSFAIDNTVGRVTIYRSTYIAGVYGSTQVYLDNNSTPLMTISNTSASLMYQQPTSFVVTPGSHIITLKNVGSTYSDIDQISLLAPAAALPVGGYQETNSNLTYVGSWTPNANTSSLGGARTYTNDPNASLTFSVDGSVGLVRIYRATYLAGVYGSMQVFLDGSSTPIATINNTSSSLLFRQSFTFTVPAGGSGHTITLKNVGTTYSDIDQISLSEPLPASMANSYQEDEIGRYDGTWTRLPVLSPYADYRRVTNDPNGRLIFRVDNEVERVTIYRSTDTTYGSMQVYLDNNPTPFITINNNITSTFMYHQPFTFLVPAGGHTITLQNVGTTYSDIDQIWLQRPAVTLSHGLYHARDNNLTFLGSWTPDTTYSTPDGTRIYTNDPNASLTFKVDNTAGQVTIGRSTYSIYGSMQVYLDNSPTPFITINNNTSTTILRGQEFTFLVPEGNHTITLKNMGTTYSDIDYIGLDYTPIIGVGNYQEDDLHLIYNGKWVANSNASAFGGTRRYTSDPNGSLNFAIDSTVGRVTIYRSTYVAGVYGSMQVYLDNNPTPFTTINNVSSTLLFQQPFTFAVPQGDHIITLKNVGSTYSDIDQITLAAPTPLTVGSYQENDANLIYNGTWTANSNASSLGGARKYTSDPNATLSFAIDDTVGQVTIYRATYLAGVYGSLEVYLDNNPTPFTTINNVSSTLLFQQPFTFSVTPGNHIITLKNVGSTYSDIDQITMQS